MGNVVRKWVQGDLETRYYSISVRPQGFGVSLRRLLRWTPAVEKDSDKKPSKPWTIFPEDSSFRLG